MSDARFRKRMLQNIKTGDHDGLVISLRHLLRNYNVQNKKILKFLVKAFEQLYRTYMIFLITLQFYVILHMYAIV